MKHGGKMDLVMADKFDLAKIPLSLYIHFPWCVQKCPYCDFNSHTLKNQLPEKNYIDALLQDFYHDLPSTPSRPLTSIFLGGGTPSLFSGIELKRLLNEIANTISFKPNIEITLEANPGTFEQEKFSAYRKAGINRLSLGCQSFNNEKLQLLGRIHGDTEAIHATQCAKKAGFDNINIDLMFGLPKQTVEEAITDLEIAISLKPQHISWYQLTLEPNTLFYHQKPTLPQDDELSAMYEQGQQLLAQAGFQQYEISAYAQNNRQAVHNLNYWTFGDYLGIGAGAHSKITQAAGYIQRTVKRKQPTDYLKHEHKILETHTVALEQIPFEFMLNALRLNEALHLDLFVKQTGLSIDILEPYLENAIQKNFIFIRDNKLYKTELGTRFVNDLMSEFL